MTTANTFPAPIGVTTAHTMLKAGRTSPNFVLEPGLYVISLELMDPTDNNLWPNNTNLALPPDQVLMQSVIAGVTTTVLTMTRSGYYNFVVPPGTSTTYNFTTTNEIKNVRATKINLSIGPS